MKKVLVATASIALIVLGIVSCGRGSAVNTQPQANAPAAAHTDNLHAFASDAELSAYLRKLAANRHRGMVTKSFSLAANLAPSQAAPSAAPSPTANVAAESITNVQHAGVDEGGIVKLHGNHLVVLRRGRLFTVSIGNGDLSPISSVDAFGPDVDPRYTWYDEMLVSENTVVVIGYSYERGGTEVGVFQIDPAGKLSYRSTYQLRSNDYYSSRNYASRLVGSKLIFYAPLYLHPSMSDPLASLPAVRRWHHGASSNEFHRIVATNRIYRADLRENPDQERVLHTVTTCDLARGGFDCKATSVIGPSGNVFYVSPTSVYIWATQWSYSGQTGRHDSTLFRMPLDGDSPPSALGVSGSPVDQFSFLESDDGYLNVLVRAEARGDGMWGAEVSDGETALLRVPVTIFADGSKTAPSSSYRRLPSRQRYVLNNRFVGDYLLYGTGNGWGYPQATEKSRLYLVRWATGEIHALPLAHAADRIEAMGADAVVIGSDGRDLHFTPVRLGRSPRLEQDYVREGASQGELRSHGFFYKPDSRNSGVLGLPVATPARAGYRHLVENSSEILFLRNDSLHFEELGALTAEERTVKDDGCRASCVDWYGNSRPLFLQGRVLALLGYELVEGSVIGGRIQEVRRVNYAPEYESAMRR